jgi:hypothetical protein
VPNSASTANSSELAISTLVSTPRALPKPSLVTKSRPMTARPLTEMATVRPAKSTARLSAILDERLGLESDRETRALFRRLLGQA